MSSARCRSLAKAAMPTVDLGFRPRVWQAECYRKVKRFSVLVIHRRGGKTVYGVMLLIDRALRFQPPAGGGPGRFYYVAPEKAQAKGICWDYFKRFASPVPGVKINEAELYIEFPNGSRIKVEGADDPDRLRGLYIDGIVLDEIADMKPSVWGEIVRPALADRKGWAMFIGTPKGINLLSELFYAAQSDPDWFAARMTINDTNALDPAEVEAARKQMSEAQFAQEFLCDFSAGNSNALLSANDVEEAARRTYHESDFAHAPRIIGIDVARQGDDRTVMVRRQGNASWPAIIMRGADAMEVAARAAREITDWKPHAIFVDGSGGYGAGVIDRLRQLGHTVIEVQFGGKPDDERFSNKRTEMWWLLAEWIKQGGAIPNDPGLKLDLCAPTYNHRNAAGKLALESKDDIKKRGLPSPDIGDAYALTFAYPVAAPSSWQDHALGLTAGSVQAAVDWDPFARA